MKNLSTIHAKHVLICHSQYLSDRHHFEESAYSHGQQSQSGLIHIMLFCCKQKRGFIAGNVFRGKISLMHKLWLC